MANKVSYAKLNLKVNNQTNTFKFMDNEIEVLKYLPVEDKYDLIMIALQKAEEDGIYNELKLDMYFHLYLVYMYTNISFTEKQKENELKLYDALQSNGFIDQLLQTMDTVEYRHLLHLLSTIKDDLKYYKNTAGAILQRIITDMPKQAQAAADIINNFNPEQYQTLVDFAKNTGAIR